MNSDEVAADKSEAEGSVTSTETVSADNNLQSQQSDEELFLAALDGKASTGSEYEEFAFAPIKRGQTIKGTVAGKTDTEILIDVGVKSEGVITGREFEQLDSETRNALRVGDEIDVFVVAPEDSSGRVELSLKRALEEKDWQEANDYLSQSKLYEGKITALNKGGLIVRFGKLRGFLPASQISKEHFGNTSTGTPEERWGSLIGQDVSVKVIEVDRPRNRLIFSERAAAKEIRAQKRTSLLSTLAVGQVITGKIISMTDFGAFVDLGGADGLIHLSEIAWEHISHPKDALNLGDSVQVEVISIDHERQRIGLSRKKLLDDPWKELVSKYEVGQLVAGQITKMTRFGAFANFVEAPEIEGLIHISELSNKHISHPREVLNEGQILTLRIIKIEAENRKVALSLKQVQSDEYMEADWKMLMDAANADASSDPEPPGDSLAAQNET